MTKLKRIKECYNWDLPKGCEAKDFLGGIGLLLYFSFLQVLDFVKSWNFEHRGKKIKFFSVNVFWCNISSWNCHHKCGIYNLTNMIFYMEMIFQAMACQECRKYFKKKQESIMHLQKSTLIICLCHVCGYSFKLKCYIRKHLKPCD